MVEELVHQQTSEVQGDKNVLTHGPWKVKFDLPSLVQILFALLGIRHMRKT